MWGGVWRGRHQRQREGAAAADQALQAMEGGVVSKRTNIQVFSKIIRGLKVLSVEYLLHRQHLQGQRSEERHVYPPDVKQIQNQTGLL